MPAPAAESDAYVSPKRRRSHTAAPSASAEASAPSATRASSPIQPRSTASTKKKTIPSSITTPPVHASARAPSRTVQSNGSLGSTTIGGCFGGGGGEATKVSDTKAVSDTGEG